VGRLGVLLSHMLVESCRSLVLSLASLAVLPSRAMPADLLGDIGSGIDLAAMAAFECSCDWTGPFSIYCLYDDGTECFNYCCAPSPSPSAPPTPPSYPPPLAPPSAPPLPTCERCDAGTECGYCLMLTSRCYISEAWTWRDTCSNATAAGELCYGDGSCGTDSDVNTCLLAPLGVVATYTRVDCTWAPPSPPSPSLPPRPPAGPGESAYLPAPPSPATPSNGVLGQGAADDGDSGFFGPISLAWSIVILVWAVLTPVLLCILCYYARQGWWCFAGRAAAEPPPSTNLGFGGTLVIEDGPAPGGKMPMRTSA